MSTDGKPLVKSKRTRTNIISACRSNMDIKYIFSGSDAKVLVYYITDYVTKSSLSFYDTVSLVLKAVQSLEKFNVIDSNSMSAEEKSRKLVLRCYNTLASQQELSASQVASYLMGWSDHYTTHEFANLFLIGIENYLQAALIEIQMEQQHEMNGNLFFCCKSEYIFWVINRDARSPELARSLLVLRFFSWLKIS